jgi:biopolymer transport protein ExbB
MNSQSVNEIIQFFNRGGFFMYLLAACSVVGVAVILLRMLGLRRDLAVPSVIRLEVERMQSDTENPTGRLAAFLMGDRSPLGRVIRVALKHLDVSRSENQDAVQVAARREMVRLEQGLFILEILIGITPLLGLL